MRKWASLHNHTIYSIKDGLGKCSEYVNKIHHFNYDNNGEWYAGLAITEHGKIIF